MLDRLTSMAAFVKAADLASFTAAGVALDLSSQMVGKHVSALEAHVGAVLLNRTTRRMRLTEAGVRYYARCRAVLAEVAAADAAMEEDDATARGRLRISAPVGFGARRLAPIVNDLLALHPKLEVELVLTDRFVDMVEEGFDAVLRLGPITETSQTAREVADHDQIACASPEYLERCGIPRAPAELERHACLGFINWSGLPFDEWRFGRDGVIHPVRIRSRFQVNDGRVLVAAAIAGHGVILQPSAVVEDAIANGRLTPILTEFVAPTRKLFLLHSAREPLPTKLSILVAYLANSLRPTSAAN